MELKDAIRDTFKYNPNKKQMHINEIAEYIHSSMPEFRDIDLESLSKKIASCLNNSVTKQVKSKKVENKESEFTRIGNGKNGYKKGVYSIRKIKIRTNPVLPDLPLFPEHVDKPLLSSPIFVIPVSGDASKMHIGKGGEFSVVSELLFRGFNANIMTVDDGIDISASKNGRFYFIQVKTTYFKDANSPISVNLDKSSFGKYNEANIFYIIVLRYISNGIPLNQFLIFSARDIERFIRMRLAGESENCYNLKFKQKSGDIFIQKGGNESSIKDVHLNNWDWIK